MQTVFLLNYHLPQLNLIHYKKLQVNIAGGRPTARITDRYAYLKFGVNIMIYDGACWYLGVLACSNDTVWGRILDYSSH